MKMKGEKFASFLKVMEIVGSGCDYLVIQKGKVRQLGNNKRNIFEVDLSELFEGEEELDIVIPNVLQKYQLIEPLYKQGCEITLTSSETGYTIKDEYSYIKIPNTLMKYVEQTNPILGDEEYRKRIGLKEKIDVAVGEIPKMIMDRISSFSRALSSRTLNVLFKENEVFLELSVADKNSPTLANVLKFKNTSEEVRGRAEFKLDPIMACPPPVDVEFMVRKDQKYATMKLETMISEEPMVTFTLWCLSELIKET